jgi:ABC-2 type transport system ATP-binding protein
LPRLQCHPHNRRLRHKEKDFLIVEIPGATNVEDIKNQFKSNTYEVIYDGENLIENDTFSIEHIDSKKKKSALISLKQNLNNNQIIQSIMNQNVEILSFSEKLPSMEEIFIKAVESSNLNK